MQRDLVRLCAVVATAFGVFELALGGVERIAQRYVGIFVRMVLRAGAIDAMSRPGIRISSRTTYNLPLWWC